MSRLLQAVGTIWVASVVVFLLSRLSGDPTALLVSPSATEQELQATRHALGLDQSLLAQYWTFLSGAITGDFGDSMRFQRPALSIALDRFPATLKLTGLAFALACLVAIPAGVYAAARRSSRFDKVVKMAAVAGQAVPSFLVATLLILVLGVHWQLFPTSGMGGPASYVLPVITISFLAMAGLFRLSRSATLETLGTEYVKFARTKGARESSVLWFHAFRNAGLTVLTFGALVFLNLLTGSVIVETVFAWPGVGYLVIDSVTARDYPVVQVVVLLLAVTYIVANFLVDIAYAFLNPKIKYSS